MTDFERGMRQGFLDLLKLYNARLYELQGKLYHSTTIPCQLGLTGKINEVKSIIKTLEYQKNELQKGNYETPTKGATLPPGCQ